MYYLGIDLGGTNIAVGVVDESYQIIARAKRKTRVPCNEGLIDDLAAAAREAVETAGITLDDVPWIGIGCPGTINRSTGIVEYANNLYLNNFKLRDMLQEKLGRPVIIENDANAAAYGEYKAGALKGADNAIAITLGTGVGGGIIINGQVYSGSNFAGGELGHIVIVCNGADCTCGRKGCWEAYSSATALIRMTREAMAANANKKDSPIWEITGGSFDTVNGRTAFDAMRAGDPMGQAIVDKYISYLACGIANCINIFQPDILCIGGGISNEGETLLAPLRELVHKETYNYTNGSKQTEICRAQLGNDAGIIGAALLGE